VQDVVVCLRAASGTHGVFNVATGIETSVQDVFDAVVQAADKPVEPEYAPLRQGELERSCMDPSNARNVLGWQAEVPLDRGIKETYDALVEEFETAAA
jgi:UDP-glucose 4-epimerase